jgi:hypothetical protein
MRIYFLLFLTIFTYTKVYSQPLKEGDITCNFVGKSDGFMVMGYNNILSEFIKKRQGPLPDSFVINYHTSLKDDSIKDLPITNYPYEKTFEFNKHLDITLYFKKSSNCYMRELRYSDGNTTDYLVREHYFYKKAIPAKFGIKLFNDDLVDSVLVEIYETSRITNKYSNFEVKKINFFYTSLDPSPNRHHFGYNERGDSFYDEPFLNYPIVVSSVRISELTFKYHDVSAKYGIFNYDNGRSEISKDSTFSLLKYLTNQEGFKDEIYNYYLSSNVSGIGHGKIYLNDPFHAWPNFETKTGTITEAFKANFFPNSRSIFSVTYPKPYKGFGSNYKVNHTYLIENEYFTPNIYQSKKITEYSVGDDKLISMDNSFFYEGFDIKKAKNKQLSTFTYLSKYSVLENLTVIDNGKKYKYKIIYKISY